MQWCTVRLHASVLVSTSPLPSPFCSQDWSIAPSGCNLVPYARRNFQVNMENQCKPKAKSGHENQSLRYLYQGPPMSNMTHRLLSTTHGIGNQSSMFLRGSQMRRCQKKKETTERWEILINHLDAEPPSENHREQRRKDVRKEHTDGFLKTCMYRSKKHIQSLAMAHMGMVFISCSLPLLNQVMDFVVSCASERTMKRFLLLSRQCVTHQSVVPKTNSLECERVKHCVRLRRGMRC